MRGVIVNVCLVALMHVIIVEANSVTLSIPYDVVGEVVSTSYTTYKPKKYSFVTIIKSNFHKAQQYCLLNNMELLSIDSKQEEITLMNYMNKEDFEFKSSKHFWIGGTDLGDEGKFSFVSNGRAVGNLLWSRNEPNNLKKPDGSETENCMAYVHSDGLKVYRLFDKFCSLKLHFICQESLTSDPCADISPRFGS
ncbi:unnamed protein product [Diamesa hyperborea]